MTEPERVEALRHCKWCDEVIPNPPWVVTKVPKVFAGPRSRLSRHPLPAGPPLSSFPPSSPPGLHAPMGGALPLGPRACDGDTGLCPMPAALHGQVPDRLRGSRRLTLRGRFGAVRRRLSVRQGRRSLLRHREDRGRLDQVTRACRSWRRTSCVGPLKQHAPHHATDRCESSARAVCLPFLLRAGDLGGSTAWVGRDIILGIIKPSFRSLPAVTSSCALSRTTTSTSCATSRGATHERTSTCRGPGRSVSLPR